MKCSCRRYIYLLMHVLMWTFSSHSKLYSTCRQTLEKRDWKKMWKWDCLSSTHNVLPLFTAAGERACQLFVAERQQLSLQAKNSPHFETEFPCLVSWWERAHWLKKINYFKAPCFCSKQPGNIDNEIIFEIHNLRVCFVLQNIVQKHVIMPLFITGFFFGPFLLQTHEF